MMPPGALAALQEVATGAASGPAEAAAHGVGFQDSVVVESPLPGGVADVVRFFFHVPRWIQIGGAILALAVALFLAFLVWRRREAILRWLRTRTAGTRLGLAGAGLLVVAVAAGAGTVSWNYMQHDNGFCTGCHVMAPSYQAFTASEHAEQQCHDCHRQSIFASARQLVMWVGERPEDIGSHAEIPDAICQECHATGEDESWTRVEQTAGHRVHFESDDSALDDVGCLTCHAPEVHEFVPIDQTCAQSGCHTDMDIRLGGMANQTSLHCATCHEFTAEVAALATTDSAASTLVPSFERCSGCHEMQAMLADFEPEREPHEARCGVCHDAHEQVAAEEAANTCAECHDDWRNEPFHTGEAHAEAGARCVLCHEPHAARVDASDCAGCHRRIAEEPQTPAGMRRRLRAAQPFDTAAVLRESRLPGSATTDAAEVPIRAAGTPNGSIDSPIRSLGLVADAGTPTASIAMLLEAPADTFEHSEHVELTCITCHTTSEGHGGLTFEPPRGCQICHHRAPSRSECGDCHVGVDSLPTVTADVSIRPVPGATRVHRTGDFDHSTHADLACVNCHLSPVSLSPPAEVASCASCHEEHHAPAVGCIGCHAVDPSTDHDPHEPPAAAHEACTACHTRTTIAGLQPDRPFCLTCHATSADHEPGEACTTCHLLETPDEFRPRLVERAPPDS